MKKGLVAIMVLASSIGHAGVVASDVFEENGRKTRALTVNVQPSAFTRVQLTTGESEDFLEKAKAKITNEVEKIKAEMKAKEKAEKLAKELLHESCFLQYGGSLLDRSMNIKFSDAQPEESTADDKQRETKRSTISIVGSATVEATCEVELFNVKDLVKEIWKSLVY